MTKTHIGVGLSVASLLAGGGAVAQVQNEIAINVAIQSDTPDIVVTSVDDLSASEIVSPDGTPAGNGRSADTVCIQTSLPILTIDGAFANGRSIRFGHLQSADINDFVTYEFNVHMPGNPDATIGHKLATTPSVTYDLRNHTPNFGGNCADGQYELNIVSILSNPADPLARAFDDLSGAGLLQAGDALTFTDTVTLTLSPSL